MEDFKPVKNEKVNISIRIDVDKLRIIDEMAGTTNISRNEMIVQCIDYALKNFKP